MIKMDILPISEVITIIARSIIYGDFSEKTRNLCEKLYSLLKNNINWINKQTELPQILFFKTIRLYSGFSYLPEQSSYSLKKNMMEIILSIWKNHKLECICIGRELVRIMQENFRHDVNN